MKVFVCFAYCSDSLFSVVYLYIDIELVFNENVMQILWLNNSDTSDKFVFSEAYRDDRNSPYTIADRVNFIDEIITDAAGADIDIDSDEELVENEEASDEDSSDEHPRRVSVNTRSGHSATRLRLF